MQIDMHYYGVYAIARLAGLRPKAAGTIATASQYVDDAVEADIQHHEKREQTFSNCNSTPYCRNRREQGCG